MWHETKRGYLCVTQRQDSLTTHNCSFQENSDRPNYQISCEQGANSRNPAVDLPESFPEYVGLPLILICWEWQQLQSNIHNIHITRSYAKCFQEAISNVSDDRVCCFKTGSMRMSHLQLWFPLHFDLSIVSILEQLYAAAYVERDVLLYCGAVSCFTR